MARVDRSKGEHDNFWMTPNWVDSMALSVYAFRLYGHIKRVTGETSTCWQSTRTMAFTCNMSPTMVSRAKKELVDLGLITITKVNKGQGRFPSDEISVVNIWELVRDDFTIEGQK
jgi:hypothetical protein